MELTEQDLELLDAYEADNLPDDERLKFETRMKEDPEFGAAVRQLLALDKVLFAQTDAQLRSFLQQKQTTFKKQKRQKTFMRRIAVLMAACVIGLGIWKIISTDPTGTKTNESIIASDSLQYAAAARSAFTHLAAPSTMSARDTTLKISGIEYYKKKQYREAIPLLKAEYDHTKNIKMLFFMGIACVGIEQPQKAIEALEICGQDNQDLIPQQDNDWYLYLAYLESFDYLKANDLYTKKLLNPDHIHHKKALLLQEHLPKIKE